MMTTTQIEPKTIAAPWIDGETPEIIKRIVQERDAWKHLGAGAWIYHEFILRNGWGWISQPLPKQYKMQQPKNCYWNAQALVRRSKGKLWYVEGFVLCKDLPLLIQHGWAIDGRGAVVDNTLQHYVTGESRSGQAEYYGVVWPTEYFTGDSGPVMMDDISYRLDNWKKRDPHFEKDILCSL
jgi:hypothetical protein